MKKAMIELKKVWEEQLLSYLIEQVEEDTFVFQYGTVTVNTQLDGIKRLSFFFAPDCPRQTIATISQKLGKHGYIILVREFRDKKRDTKPKS